MLETCINLIETLDVEEIFINTFYLKDQIRNFINKKNFKPKISIIEGDRVPQRGGQGRRVGLRDEHSAVQQLGEPSGGAGLRTGADSR